MAHDQFKFEYVTLEDDEPTVQERPDGTAKFVFNPLRGNAYNTFNIEITAPIPEGERTKCDVCLDKYEACVVNCSKSFLRAARGLVIFATMFIDPFQACLVGGMMLFAHCIQVCALDVSAYLANRILKPMLHAWYENIFYPFLVCFRVCLDGCNICLEPCFILCYRCSTPCTKVLEATRCCEARNSYLPSVQQSSKLNELPAETK